jgi:hypothetical protein
MISTAFWKDLPDPAGQARLVGVTLGACDMEVADGVVTYRWQRACNGTIARLSLDMADEPFAMIFATCVAAQAAGVLADLAPRDLHTALADEPPEGRAP